MDTPALSPDPDKPHAPEPARTVDDFGTEFRPGFHRVNPDGSPFKGARGQFMPKGGRKARGAADPSAPPAPAGAPVAGPAAVPAADPKPAPVPPGLFDDVERIAKGGVEAAAGAQGSSAVQLEVVDHISHEASAEAWLRGSYATLDGILAARGEWQPKDDAEHKGLKDTLVAWQRARGWRPLPPGGAFVMSCLAFIWRRLREPNTARTLVNLWPGLAPFLGVAEPQKTEKQVVAEKTDAARSESVKRQAVNPGARAEDFFQ